MIDGCTCGTCPYWEQIKDEDGECRAHAPRPGNREDSDHYGSYWPTTNRDHWCGEHPAIEVSVVMGDSLEERQLDS